MADDIKTLQLAKAALAEDLITQTDYDRIKDAFVEAQKIKTGFDAGLITEKDADQARLMFLSAQCFSSGNLQQRVASTKINRVEPTTRATKAPIESPVSQVSKSQSPVAQPRSPPKQLPTVTSAAIKKPAEVTATPASPVQSQRAKGVTSSGYEHPFVPEEIRSAGKATAEADGKVAMSGISINPDALDLFYEIQMRKRYRWAVFEVVGEQQIQPVDVGRREETYEDFILSALAPDRCCYCVYDYEFKNQQGIQVSKVVFIIWNADGASIKSKMVFASCKDFFRQFLKGVHVDLSATDLDDVDESIIQEITGSLDKRSR